MVRGLKGSLARELEGRLNGKGFRFAVVVAKFNEFATRKLLEGALEGLRTHGTDEDDITVAWVPGSLELGVVTTIIAKSRKYAAVICLGAVVRGETGHYDVVATQSTKAISRIALETGVPIITGILTTENSRQAVDRAGGKTGNKGYDAALSAIEMANLIVLLKEESSS